MPAVADLRDRLTSLFADSMHVDVPSPETDLFDSGVLDSLAFVELLTLLREEFGVTTAVEDIELENFSSIDRIATFVAARTS